ncbi:MAG: hypothetical protein M3144_04745 [Actinomycetota bacterium]|nr:hypothetical protein [Actinomycetota bacterium]
MIQQLPPPPPRKGPWPWLLGLLVLALVAAGVVAVAIRSGDDGGERQVANTATPTTVQATPSTEPESPTTIASDVPPAHKQVFDELMAQVAKVRGLQWRGPLNLKVVPTDELARLLREANARDLDPEQLASEGEALKLLQLIPSDADLQQILDDVLAGVVLGFYDPITRELYVGGDEIDASTKYTIVHEMTHALTDQVFNYGPPTIALDEEGKTEESAAYSGLIEGDAVLTQQVWAGEFLTEEEAIVALLGGGASSDGAAALSRTPPYIIQALFFPYDEGLTFVERLHDTGGFEAVNAAYRKPPTSTEQILNPETYLAGQGSPSPVVPDVAAAAGCTAVRTGSVGQFDMRAALDRHLSRNEAASAVEGWNGDTYRLIRCGSSYGLVDRWQTDPGTDPGRLATAITKWAGQWSGSGRAPGSDGRFSGSHGAGRVVTTGTHVDLVLAYDQATADRLAQALG